MDYIIRPYNYTDKEACLIAFESNVPKSFTKDEINLFSNFLDTFQNKNTTNKTYYYVLVLNNEIIGCGGFGDKEGTNKITLAWGLIHAHFHKKGFGELLLKFRLKKIKEIHPNNDLYIDTTQHSHGFFEKFGFVTTKITPDFYEKGLHCYDMVLNEKVLKNEY